MPTFSKHKLGWRCACDRFYGIGHTRAIAFNNWRAAALGGMMPEQLIREDFSHGDFNCIRCGKQLHLHWNGGELDQVHCCNVTYFARDRGFDLYAQTGDDDVQT